MEEPEKLLIGGKAPYIKEDAEISNIKNTLSSYNDETTKVEKSPLYDDILRAYIRMRHEPNFNLAKFHRNIVEKFDSEINISNLRSWTDKLKRNEKQAWDMKVRLLAEDALDTDATVETIRKTSIKVFYLKIQEFLQNPDILDKMTFNQALQLYDKIEKLNLATEKLRLDKHDQGRKDAFTVFSMGILSGKVKEGDINNIFDGEKVDEGQPNQATSGIDGEDIGT